MSIQQISAFSLGRPAAVEFEPPLAIPDGIDVGTVGSLGELVGHARVAIQQLEPGSDGARSLVAETAKDVDVKIQIAPPLLEAVVQAALGKAEDEQRVRLILR